MSAKVYILTYQQLERILLSRGCALPSAHAATPTGAPRPPLGSGSDPREVRRNPLRGSLSASCGGRGALAAFLFFQAASRLAGRGRATGEGRRACGRASGGGRRSGRPPPRRMTRRRRPRAAAAVTVSRVVDGGGHSVEAGTLSSSAVGTGEGDGSGRPTATDAVATEEVVAATTSVATATGEAAATQPGPRPPRGSGIESSASPAVALASRSRDAVALPPPRC